MFDMLFLYIKDLSYSSSCSQVASVTSPPSCVQLQLRATPNQVHAMLMDNKMLILKLLFSLLGPHSPVIHVISRL